jgi:hypothetical protein
MMQRYRYQPLPEVDIGAGRSSDHIRVATILPGIWEEDIYITVCQQPFSETQLPAYEAVSYAWGPEEANSYRVVVVSHSQSGLGRPLGWLPVRQNLRSALQYLRLEDRPRPMWIDAVCIDQNDMEQKGHQVRYRPGDDQWFGAPLVLTIA